MTAVAEKPQAEPDAGAVPSFEVTLRIARFTPEDDKGVHWEDFTVTMLSLIHISEPTRRLRGSRMPSSA